MLKSKGMLENIVIGFSSDNGGPLDHANNAPFRGGKHTLWEVSYCMPTCPTVELCVL